MKKITYDRIANISLLAIVLTAFGFDRYPDYRYVILAACSLLVGFGVFAYFKRQSSIANDAEIEQKKVVPYFTVHLKDSQLVDVQPQLSIDLIGDAIVVETVPIYRDNNYNWLHDSCDIEEIEDYLRAMLSDGSIFSSDDVCETKVANSWMSSGRENKHKRRRSHDNSYALAA